MSSFIIHGGKELKGEVRPQGAKNEALQIICATLLTKKTVTIKNIPEIVDVLRLIEILKSIGVTVERKAKGHFVFEANQLDLVYLKSAEFKKDVSSLRGSVMLVGPLLTRIGHAYLSKPGGDKIGRRRLDTHFLALEKLSASFTYDDESSCFEVTANQLIGADILLEEASVTGTANIIMAAVMAEGNTSIYNAACEPYIQQLCKMLVAMGANISGIGSNLLLIKGVEKLDGCTHTILPDMIEIGSWIGMAAMTKSELTIKNVSWENLGIIPEIFRKMGIDIIKSGDDMIIPKKKQYKVRSFIDGTVLTVSDAPWPGFTPDLLSIILVVATQAKGSVLIHQKMFESRLFFVDKLIDMGAKIILCDPHRATVIGMNHEFPLRGTNMSSPDIRAGISLLIAALGAKGKSVINNIGQIDRGYEDIDGRLLAIGADITRVE